MGLQRFNCGVPRESDGGKVPAPTGGFPQTLASLNSLLDTTMNPNLDHILLLTRSAIPPSLTTALISALGASTEMFALPLTFSPTMKHICAPFAEEVEFGAHSDAHVHLKGQLIQSPRIRMFRC